MNNYKKKSNFLSLVIHFLFSHIGIDNEIFNTNRRNNKLNLKQIFLAFILIFIAFIGYFFQDEINLSTKNILTIVSEKKFNKNDTNSLKVLILPFEEFNSVGSKYNIEKALFYGLESESEKSGFEIKLILSKSFESNINKTKALEIGKRKGADIVVYGSITSIDKELELKLLIVNDLVNQFLNFNEGNSSTQVIKPIIISSITNFNNLESQEYILYSLLGLKMLNKKEYEMALNYFNKAQNCIDSSQSLNECKSNHLLLLSLAYLTNNHIENALNTISQALQLNHNNEEALLTRIIINLTTNTNHQLIINDINLLKKLKNYDFIAYFLSGIFNFFYTLNFDEAINDLHVAETLENSNSDIPAASILRSLLEGDYTEYSEYDKTTNNYNALFNVRINILFNYLNGNINNILKIIPLYRQIIKEQRFSNTNFFHSFISNASNFNLNNDYNNIEKLIFKLIITNNYKEIDDLKTMLKFEIKNNPNYKYYYNLNNLSKDSVILIKNNISKLKQNYFINNNNHKALAELSDLYKKLGLTINADYYAKKAISKNIIYLNYFPNTKISFCDTLFEMKLKQIDSMMQILKFNKSNIHYNRGCLLYQIGYINQAKNEYKIHLKRDPNHLYSYINLALVEYNNNNFQEALKYYNLAIKIRPNLFYNYYNRHYTYLKLNQIQNAIDDINKSIILFNKKDAKVFNIELNRLKYQQNLLLNSYDYTN